MSPPMARILITGCSTGIGRAAASELADRGHHVVATARDPASLEGLDVAQRLALDVVDDASVAAVAAAVGEIDVLVNNAGVSARGAIESYPLDEARRLFETNVFGVLRTIGAFAPGMRERGAGLIVNVSSVEGVVSSPLGGIYSATKHALEAISDSLRLEIGHFGVRVVVIQPGYFATAMREKKTPVPIDGTPYEGLRRQWDGADERLLGGPRPGADVVARAIADVVEADDPPTRLPVGDDALMVTAFRKQLDDAAFEAAMRETLGLTW